MIFNDLSLSRQTSLSEFIKGHLFEGNCPSLIHFLKKKQVINITGLHCTTPIYSYSAYINYVFFSICKLHHINMM